MTWTLHEELDGLRWMPLRTPTLPPATHTNCYILGEGLLTVVDPGSPYPDEQRRLSEALKRLEAQGHHLACVLLTHHHQDHVGGLSGLPGAKVWAHPGVGRRLGLSLDRCLGEGDSIPGGYEVLHTPGHTRSHLSLWHPKSASLICGDLMAAQGTILIDPPEGNMTQYLASLARVRALSPEVIYPAHGEPIEDALGKIDEYIHHRLQREAAISAALRGGAETPLEIVARVYGDTAPRVVWPLAARSVSAHLEKLLEEKSAEVSAKGKWRWLDKKTQRDVIS